MDLRMKCQTEMSRGPLAEEHSRKEIVGAAPPIAFLPWSSSAFPLAFLSAFVRRFVGGILCLGSDFSCCKWSWVAHLGRAHGIFNSGVRNRPKPGPTPNKCIGLGLPRKSTMNIPMLCSKLSQTILSWSRW